MSRARENYKLDPPEPVTPGPSQHPGPWIKAVVLTPFGLSISKASELIGVDRAGLSLTLSGKYAVTADLAYKLEALTGVDADLLIAMQAAYERDRDRPLREAYKKAIARLPAPVEHTDA